MGQSLLNKFAALSQEATDLQEQIERMHENPELQKEFEFRDKLMSLMQEYGKSTPDVLALLMPSPDDAEEKGVRKRAKRKMKTYKNPTTGEVIETRGGNHRTLKAWKQEHGSDVVESWVVDAAG